VLDQLSLVSFYLGQSVLNQFDACDKHVYQLDTDEGNYQSPQSVNEQVLPQQGFGA
jgi:hypothetical protein